MKKIMKWKFNFKFSYLYPWIFIMRKVKNQKAIDIEINILKTLIILSLKEFSNINQAAKHFNISLITFKWWFIDRKSIIESHESTQLLSISKEKILAQCITRLTASEFPVTHDLLQEMVEEIRQWRLHGINESFIAYIITKNDFNHVTSVLFKETTLSSSIFYQSI